MPDDGERLVIRGGGRSELARTDGGSFHLVQRDQLQLGEVAIGVSENPPGIDGVVHRHTCGEVFVVYDGLGIYTVDDVEIVAGPGDMVVIPPNTWHSFRPADDHHLRHVAVYDAGSVDIEVASRPGSRFEL